eukprot:1191019-Prorocentrum_minimum.AAC.1
MVAQRGYIVRPGTIFGDEAFYRNKESMWGYTATTLTHGVCLSLATDDLHDILRRETFAAASRHLRRVVVRMQARKIASLLAKVVEPVNEICRTMITIRNRLHMRG